MQEILVEHDKKIYDLLESIYCIHPLPLACWDRESSMLYANEKFLDLFKVQNIDEYSKKFYTHTPTVQPDDKGSYVAFKLHIESTIEFGFHRFSWLKKMPQTDEIIVEYAMSVINCFDETIIVGQIINMRAMHTSLMEKYSADKQIQTLFEIMPTPVCVWSKENVLLDCNSRFLSLLGLHSRKSFANSPQSYYPLHQADCSLSCELLAEERKLTIEERQRKLFFEWHDVDGQVIPSDIVLRYLEYGDFGIIIGYIYDLRETIAYSQRAIAAEERAQVMLDSLPLGINIVDKSFNLVECNATAAQIFGFDDKQEYMESFSCLLPEFQPNGTSSEDELQQMLMSTFLQSCATFELMYKTRNGDPLPVQISTVCSQYHGEDVIACYIKDLREIKEIQRKADITQARNQATLANIPLCITFINRNGEIVDSNNEVLRIFDFASKEEYIEHFFDIAPEYQSNGKLSRDLIPFYVNEAFEKGTVSFEWEHETLDGKKIPTEVIMIRTIINEEEMLIAYEHDLRELRKSQKKAAEAERRNQLILDTMPLSAHIWNAHYEVIDCNMASLSMFGFDSKEEYIAQIESIYPLYQPDGRMSVDVRNEMLTEVMREGFCRKEIIHQKPDGTPVPVLKTLIRTPYEDDYAVVAYAHDLREINATRAIAEEAELRNQLMLDSLPLGVHFWDECAKLIDCNMECLRLFGFSSKEEYLSRFFETIPDCQPDGQSSRELMKSCLAKAFAEGFASMEFVGLENNTKRKIDLEVLLVRIEYKGNYAIITYIRDLREFKKMLNNLSAAKEDLRQAKEVAENSTKAKGEFLATMSHEIRTPMNGILGLLHLLNQTQLSSTQADYVDKTLFSANNLLRIINDILDFSKIEAGKLEFECVPFTLNNLCEDVRNLYAPMCDNKCIDLHIHGGEFAEMLINGDPLRLKQVIFNLVSNAIKFTDQGSVSLNIESIINDDSEMQCTFSVTDTGIGLDKKQISRLFSAFSQADSSVTRKYGGTGLGLVISRSIINMMHGNIWVESKVGEGSTFYCSAIFPMCQKDISEACTFKLSNDVLDLNEDKSEQYGDYNFEHIGGHILLVEDNEINQIVAEEVLLKVGYRVDIANHGQEAIEKIEQAHDNDPYDLVLMDILMPIMDGYAATQKLRRQEKYAKLPIIAMSAHAMSGAKEKSIANGMNDHITKPIIHEVLYNTLNKWISRYRYN